MSESDKYHKDCAASYDTYFMVAIASEGEHVVVNFGDRWLPGEESAAVIHFTGGEVQRCVHGCRGKRENTITFINQFTGSKHFINTLIMY